MQFFVKERQHGSSFLCRRIYFLLIYNYRKKLKIVKFSIKIMSNLLHFYLNYDRITVKKLQNLQ